MFTGRKRLDHIVASVVAVVLVGTGVVAAVRHEGFRATQVNLDDGGVWVTNTGRGSIGRVNTQIRAIEVAPDTDSASFDVVQVDDAVVVVDADKSLLRPVDIALAQVGEGRTLPAGGRVQIGGETGAVVDPSAGRVWVMPAAGLGGFDLEADATTTAGEGAVTAVAADGTVHVYGPGDDAVETWTVDAAAGRRSVTPVAEPAITTVGTVTVVLDRASGRLQIPGQRDPVDLDPWGEDPVLQQPGPTNDAVLVATDDALLSVPLGGGAVEVIDDSGSGNAVEPVWSEGCAYGAWELSPRYAQVCDGRDPQVDSIEGWSNVDMVLRVNRRRVVLNDRATGLNLLFTEDEPEPVDDWDDALSDREDEDDIAVVPPSQDACDARATDPAEAVDDVAATVAGRPVIVPVLDNDKFEPCDVLVVNPVEGVDPAVATVAVVDDGAAIQVTPAPAYTGPVRFAYTVAGNRGATATASVGVEVKPENAPNGAPTPEDDETIVEAGRSVVHDVLVNDTDPDGDALTLIDVDFRGTGGTVQYQSNGQIRFTAGGAAVGPRTVTYTVSDGRRGTAEGRLTVQVQPEGSNIAPTARNDRLVAFVGRPSTVDLLANDTDPNDDPLRVVSHEADPVLAPELSDDGVLTVTPTAAGSYVFAYVISDDGEEVEGFVRIDVREADDNHRPIAVRDDVVVRPGTPALVDLVANDIDLDGDVLSVISTTVDQQGAEQGDVVVEVIENHVARVSVGASFTAPAAVRYQVTDGSSDPVEGVLVVRPYFEAGIDQPPIAVRDEARLRAGNATSIPVLTNDIDPEGAQLTLLSVAPVGDGDDAEGNVFVEGDELRFQAHRDAVGTYRTNYEVVDAAGNQVAGEVVITVDPLDTPNRAPAAPMVEGRARSGKTVLIPVPLVGLDPDGDPVGIVGVVDPPAFGRVEVVPDGLEYTADSGAQGMDTFTFTVRDSGGEEGEPLEALGTARVVVVPPGPNSAPVAVPDRITLGPGEERVIPVLANDTDPDDDPLALLIDGPDVAEAAREGVLGGHADAEIRVEDGAVVYRAPDVAENTQDAFSYGITDGRGGTARGLVSIAIVTGEREPVPPAARDDVTLPVLAGSRVVVDVLRNDFDPDDANATFRPRVLAFDAASVLDDGRVQVDVGDASVAFIYEIVDADGEPAYALVQIPVVDELPVVANPDEATVEPGETVRIPVLDNDESPAGGRLTLERVRDHTVRGGTARIDGDVVEFTAAVEGGSAGGFAYEVSDGDTRAVGFVAIAIDGNYPPTLSDTSVELPAGGRREVDLQALVDDIDQDDGHEFTVAGDGNGITADVDGPTLVITATAQSRDATATLAVTATDRGGDQDDATVTVTVLPFDGPPPVAVDDEARTTEGEPTEPIPVTANDINPAGQALSVSIEGSPQGGTAMVTGTNAIVFTPGAGFFGVALVTYRLSDDTGERERESLAVLRVTVVGLPDQPPAPTGTPESHQVRLTWGVPANNGGPITGYVVEAEGAGTQEASSNSLVFTGLTNGRTYRFRVAARNEAVTDDSKLDPGPWSAPIVPDQVPDAPSPPAVDCSAVTACDTALPVSWTPPRVDGTAISSYTVRISPAPVSGPSTQTLPGSQTSLVWNGLSNGTRYTFSVRATNDAGDSDWSAASSPQFPAGQPLAPPSVTAARNDQDITVGGLVDVTWTFVDASHANGDPPNAFTVAAVPQGSGAGRTITVAGNARQATINGLTNGADYVFEVWATNRWGDGLTGQSAPATPARRPTRVGSVTASPGDRVVDLTFAAPDDGGEPIGHYEVRSNHGSHANLGPNDRRVSGLVNGQSYTFEVRACSSVAALQCAEQWSPLTAAVVPYGPPSAPPNLSVSRSGSTLTWTWGASDGNGRAITGYRLSNAGSGTRGPSDRSFSRAGNPGDSFTLCVVAVNEANLTSSQSCTAGSIPTDGSLSRGDPSSVTSGSCAANCWNVVVNYRSMPSGSYTVTCYPREPGFEVTLRTPISIGGNGAYETACLAGRSTDVTLRLSGPSCVLYSSSTRLDGHYNGTSVSRC